MTTVNTCPCDGKKCKLTIDDKRHQTNAGYHAGCRCDLCKQANNAYKQAQIAAVLSDPTHKYHGTTAGYVYKCRCDDCCTANNAYYLSRKQKISEYYANRYLVEKDKISARNKAFQQANPHVRRGISHRRRAKIKDSTFETFKDLEIFERDQWICQICYEPVDKLLPFPMGMSKSLDHIIPISKGGPHTIDNVRLAHLKCNMKKSDKLESYE